MQTTCTTVFDYAEHDAAIPKFFRINPEFISLKNQKKSKKTLKNHITPFKKNSKNFLKIQTHLILNLHTIYFQKNQAPKPQKFSTILYDDDKHTYIQTDSTKILYKGFFSKNKNA